MGRLLVFNAGCLLLAVAVAVISVESTGLPTVNTYPPEDQYIASKSGEDVLYNCTVEPPDNATAKWEVDNTQLNSQELLEHFERMGIYIYSETGSESVINVTQLARTRNRTVQCVGSVDGTNSEKGDILHVRSFDSPLQPRNVRLEPGEDGSLLQWERPQNAPDQVQTIYTVNITSFQDGSIVYENTTVQSFLPLRLVEDHIGGRACGLYQILVYGVNDAGRGLISEPVIETIPQSPSVSNLSQSLTVEAVTLGSLSAVISFAEAEVCNENFTLTNYSAVINGRITFLVDADKISPSPVDGKLRMELNETSVQDEFLPGSTYEVAVRACTAVTCRTSTTVVLNTTHTQRVDILMFEDRLFVRCTFADQSDALGCNVRFSASDGNETELFQISRENGSSCNQTNYRLREYSNVTVNDVGANGTEGNTKFYMVPREIDTLEGFLDITQCPPDLNVAPIASTDRGAITIAGVVCAITVIITIVVVIIVVVCVCIKKRKLKGRTEYELDISQSSNSSKAPLKEISPRRASIRMTSIESKKEVDPDAEPRIAPDGEAPITDQSKTLEEPDGVGDMTICTTTESAGLIMQSESQTLSPQQKTGAVQQATKQKASEQQKADDDDEKYKVMKTDRNITIATCERNVLTIKASEMARFFNVDTAKYKLKVKFE